MKLRGLTQARARGAAYVEVLVIVGIVLVLGLLAVNLLGTSSTEQAGKEADCIRSFSCGAGAARGASGPLASVVGASPAVREAAELRSQLDAANRAMADAEDRVAAANRAMQEAMRNRGNYRNRPSPAVVAARADLTAAERALREANRAYNEAGQRVLDHAYGGSYGTLARNWIDIQNTGPFLHGLAVGTYDGVVGTPAAVSGLASRAWEWMNGRSPAADPAAERAARIRERQEYVEHELLRISPGGGARANYEDGHYDGEHVVAGVVVGEGVGLVIRGGVAGARVLAGPGVDAAAAGAPAVARVGAPGEAAAPVVAAARAGAGTVVRTDLEGSVQGMFNGGPNRWTRLPTNPQGEIFTRGVSGDYAAGAGGTQESLAWLRGAPSDVPRHVSTPGSPGEIARFVEETNSGYANPLMIQGRAPNLYDHTGRMASIPAGTTIDAVEAIGMFPNRLEPLSWTRSYLDMRHAVERAGIPLDAGSRGAAFTRDLEGVMANTVRFGENEYGRFITNTDEVEAALLEVFSRYP